MGTNDHARNRDHSGDTTPSPGHDRIADDTHALRAGKDAATQRKTDLEPEAPTRDEGRDDRRSGSESNAS